MSTNNNSLLEKKFFLLHEIIGNKKSNPPIPALIPVSRATFMNGTKTGLYPRPVKISQRLYAWKKEDILELIKKIGGDV